MRKINVLAVLALAACQPPTASQSSAEQIADNIEAMADNIEAMTDDPLADAAKAAQSQMSAEPASGWAYSESKDEMRGASTKLAQLDANAPISLAFPYGESTPVLNIRRDPKYGFDIFITANGQFLCRSYNDDTISVKFDDGPIREWPCAEADSGSSEIIFLNREEAFLAAIRKAKKVIVEANMYNAGRQQMAFNVAGLNWK